MTQSHSLRHMARTRAPDKRVLERLLERAMNLVAYVFDSAAAADNQGFAEVRNDAFSLAISSHAQGDEEGALSVLNYCHAVTKVIDGL